MPAPLTDDTRQRIIAAVEAGAHPNVACTAAGMGKSYWYDLRYRARHGDQQAIELVGAIESAAARSEVDDVEATRRATQAIDENAVLCPHCGQEFEAKVEQLAAIIRGHESVQKAKASAAEVALKKLERRHPKRWSQKVIQPVQEEHERLLDVAQRVLEPEVFKLLLEEYLAEGSGESETSSGSSERTGGGVH